MIHRINQVFGFNTLFGFWGRRALRSTQRSDIRMDNGTFNIYNYEDGIVPIRGSNSIFNIHGNKTTFVYSEGGSFFNLYKQNQELMLDGWNNVANLYAPKQTIYSGGFNNLINQYSYGALIKVVSNAKGSVINMYGWSSRALIRADENKINLGLGNDLRVELYGDSNVATAIGAGARISIFGSNNIAYLKGSNQYIGISGRKNIAEIDGGWSVDALVEGEMNTINIRGGSGRINIRGQRNTVNLYQQNRQITTVGRGSEVNLLSQGQTATLAGISQVATIFNTNRLSVKGVSHTKISIGSTGSSIDVSQLRSGVIYQAAGSQNSIIGNADRRIMVINTSLAFFTSTLAGIGPPPIPAGASFTVATSALGAQTAITIST